MLLEKNLWILASLCRSLPTVFQFKKFVFFVCRKCSLILEKWNSLRKVFFSYGIKPKKVKRKNIKIFQLKLIINLTEAWLLLSIISSSSFALPLILYCFTWINLNWVFPSNIALNSWMESTNYSSSILKLQSEFCNN